MLIGGRWTAARSGQIEEVRSPYDGGVVGAVATAGPADVEPALAAAEHGAATWRRTPAHERIASCCGRRSWSTSGRRRSRRTLSAENGKTITEATSEAGRSGDMIRLAAFEGTQLYGETLPLDANRGTGFDKIGFTLRQPCGVVVAITPFNYPALLVLHKVAPALAAGKRRRPQARPHDPAHRARAGRVLRRRRPARRVLSVLTGPGGSLGDALVSDPRVRKVSFTGSTGVGEHIAARPGSRSCRWSSAPRARS